MKKALVVATVAGFIAGFEFNNVLILKEMGYEVHIAANMDFCNNTRNLKKLLLDGVIAHDIKFFRNPFKKENIKAFKELKSVVKKERFDLIHCHTPVGGVLGRLAARGYRKFGTKVIYTVHGFHFCKTAPKKNWLIFYPVEWLCSHWTDVLITINEEDYAFAQKHMRAKRVEYVPGVGIDLNKFAPEIIDDVRKLEKRTELGIKDTDTVFVSVGEINKDKNQILMIKAMKKIRNTNYKYFICGEGRPRKEYEKYVEENGLENNVKLLGYRRDVAEILQLTDVFVFPSTFEGLSLALMEAIASRVMVICSASRGNMDLIKDKRCMFNCRSVEELIQSIHNVESMSKEDRQTIIEDNYSRLLPREKSAVIERMKEIYKETEGMSK